MRIDVLLIWVENDIIANYVVAKMLQAQAKQKQFDEFEKTTTEEKHYSNAQPLFLANNGNSNLYHISFCHLLCDNHV